MTERKAKGTIQITLGFIGGILFLLSPVSGLLGVYTHYKIGTDEALLTKLGIDASNYDYSVGYWVGRSVWHCVGLYALAAFLFALGMKKLQSALLAFAAFAIYSLGGTVFHVASGSWQEQGLVYTAGAWLAEAISWIPKHLVELGLLVQGPLGLRKRLQVGNKEKETSSLGRNQKGVDVVEEQANKTTGV